MQFTSICVNAFHHSSWAQFFPWKVVTSPVKTIEVFISYLKDGFGSRFHALELRKFGFWTLGLCLKSDQTSTNSFECFPFVSVWEQWRRFGLEGYTTCFWPHVFFFPRSRHISELKKWAACQNCWLKAQARAATETSVSNLWLVLSPRRLTPFEFQRQTAIKGREKCGIIFVWRASIWRKVEGFLRNFAVPALYWV